MSKDRLTAFFDAVIAIVMTEATRKCNLKSNLGIA